MSRIKWGIAAALMFCAGAASAQAQQRIRTTPLPSEDISRLDFNASGEDSLINQTGKIGGEGKTRIAITGLYLNQPSVTRLGDGKANARLAERYSGILLASHAPNEWVELYLQAPVVMYQSEMSSLSHLNFKPTATGGLEQPLVGGRVGILHQSDTMPLNLAVGVGVSLPVGSEAALAQDDRVRFQPSVSAGRDFGKFTVGGQVYARFRAQENFAYRGLEPVTNTGDTLTHELGIGASGSYRIMDKLRAEVDVVADMALKDGGATVQPIAAVRYQLLKNMELYAGGGFGFGSLVGTARHEVFAGFSFNAFGGGMAPAAKTETMEEKKVEKKAAPPVALDSDGDGIPDTLDKCPKEPEDKDGFEDSDGCPDLDNDGDGVPDAKDACPNEAGPAHRAGCKATDADKDGVPDDVDRCPNEAGDPNEGGCPIKDTDKDGLPDSQDLCPTEAGDRDHRGCPVKDADKDGVPDDRDNCVNEKGVPENAGCPKQKPQLVVITKEKLVISDKVYFTPGKATILPKSKVLLDQIAKILKEHQEIPKIRVEGHTDNVGVPAKNQKLSEDRANSVRDYLIKAGVKAEKVVAQGFGQDKPIADNNTAQGRETNRRVEFVIVEPEAKTNDSGTPELAPLTK